MYREAYSFEKYMILVSRGSLCNFVKNFTQFHSI